MDILVWLENTFIANAIRTIPWLYPTFETGHYIGLSLLVGGIMLIDLRVLGFARALPLKILRLETPDGLYRCKLTLVRPDQHIAWHGNALADAAAIIDRVRGA